MSTYVTRLTAVIGHGLTRVAERIYAKDAVGKEEDDEDDEEEVEEEEKKNAKEVKKTRKPRRMMKKE